MLTPGTVTSLLERPTEGTVTVEDVEGMTGILVPLEMPSSELTETRSSEVVLVAMLEPLVELSDLSVVNEVTVLSGPSDVTES